MFSSNRPGKPDRRPSRFEREPLLPPVESEKDRFGRDLERILSVIPAEISDVVVPRATDVKTITDERFSTPRAKRIEAETGVAVAPDGRLSQLFFADETRTVIVLSVSLAPDLLSTAPLETQDEPLPTPEAAMTIVYHGPGDGTLVEYNTFRGEVTTFSGAGADPQATMRSARGVLGERVGPVRAMVRVEDTPPY